MLAVCFSSELLMFSYTQLSPLEVFPSTSMIVSLVLANLSRTSSFRHLVCSLDSSLLPLTIVKFEKV